MKVKDDVNCMVATMNLEDKNKMSIEMLNFHEKVNKIIESKEEVYAIHMAAIKVNILNYIQFCFIF